MSSPKSTVRETGKIKTQMLGLDKLDAVKSPAVNTSTPPSLLAKKSRAPQLSNTETTVRSLSRPLLRDSNISRKIISTQPTVADRRLSMLSAASSRSKSPISARRPQAYMPSCGAPIDSQSSPTVYIPSYSPTSHSTNTAVSAPAIAQSMLTGFKYDPYDRTPPRRKMAADVAAFVAAKDESSSSSSTSITSRRPLFIPGSNGEALVTPASSSRAGWPSVMHGQAGIVTAATLPSHLEADLADFREVVEAAKGPHDPRRQSDSSITRQPYKIAKELEPSDIEERIQRANCVTHLERLGEPHTRLSTMTDCSIPFFWSEKAETEAETSSVNVSFQDVQDTKTSDSAVLPLNNSQITSLKSLCSAQGLGIISDAASQKSKVSNTSVSFLPTKKILQGKPNSKDEEALDTSRILVSNLTQSFRHDREFPTDPGNGCNPFQNSQDRGMLVLPSGGPENKSRSGDHSACLSAPFPVASVATIGATPASLLEDNNDSRSDVEAQERPPRPCRPPLSLSKSQGHTKRKPLSTLSFHFCVGWPNFWRFVAEAVLVITFLAFMVIALVSISRTKLYSVPSDHFISSSRTMTSEDGSSNLTISWVGGQAVGFRISPSYNLTFDLNEPKPDEIRFEFDWSAEGLSILSGSDRKLVNSMPIPSFGKKLIELVGFLGLFLLIFFIVHKALRFLSKLGHQRENGNVYITEKFLGWFDKGIDWVSLILGVVGSTLIWARATLLLLLW